jgi:predicted signal transduction protein with EAL and GGDEF domain
MVNVSTRSGQSLGVMSHERHSSGQGTVGYGIRVNQVDAPDRLAGLLASAGRDDRRLGLVFLDLAEALRSTARASDTVARLGGDEFVVLQDIADASSALEVAARLTPLLDRSVLVDGHEVPVSASVGVAVSSPGDTPSTLLRHADVAMYRARTDGKARAVLFDQAMEASAVERLELEADLRRALDKGEFRVFYQPTVSLSDGR